MYTLTSDSEEEGSSALAKPEIKLGKRWETIGPFPCGMREHPLIASPLHTFLHDESLDPDVDFATRPYGDDETFPSELGFGGRVGWDRFAIDIEGWTDISFPDIRWDQLRRDHGWAALQYQTLLRTSLTITSNASSPSGTVPVLIDLIQGVEFALIPVNPTGTTPNLPITWYQGDIYNFANTPSGNHSSPSRRTSNFARSLSLSPGEYTVIVRAIYEIRMFGDPGVEKAPVIKMKFEVEVDSLSTSASEGGGVIEVMSGLGNVPDIVGGWFMGDWISVGIRALSSGGESVTISGVKVMGQEGLFRLLAPVRILQGQVRPVVLSIKQTHPLYESISHISIVFEIISGPHTSEVEWSIIPTHKTQQEPFKMTFASPSTPLTGPPSLVSYAAVIPPSPSSSSAKPKPQSPVILATHGAGVDALSPFWIEAIPETNGWAVLPTGKNEWGEDYHGGSMDDCWAARYALPTVVGKLSKEVSEDTILMGHSNGGQGAWHLGARFPDRIVGMVVASGWLKIQDYVPYTSAVSSHYADPSLMGILHSSLTPYNNDIHASNLAHLPILVVHGSEDDNVPPTHSRSHVALVSSWQGTQTPSNVRLIEVKKESHWWDDVFRVEGVKEFLEGVERVDREVVRRKGFTLTIANPVEGGGKAGIRIVELDTPGRLARLDVNARQWSRGPDNTLQLHGMNVKRISIEGYGQYTQVDLNGKIHPITEGITTSITSTSSKPSSGVRAYGPMIRLLATSGPMVFIIPSNNPRFVSLATRLAHDLYVYHRVDSEIISDQQGLEKVANSTIGVGNIVSIGRPDENLYTAWMIAQKKIPLTFPTKSVMLLNDKLIYERGTGIITLHPHPVDDKGLSAIIAGNDDHGTELAARLFPIRTGVPIPDWVVVGLRSIWQGANGFIGAGFWGNDWGWNEAMSWTDR